jgi:hypothetical protein
MKKKIVFLGILIIVLTFGTIGCGNSSNLETQISDLKKEIEELSVENKNLEEEIKTYKDREEVDKQEKIKAEEEKSKNKQIKLNESITVEGYGEFVIKSAELKQKVTPPNPASFFTYYEVKDPNEIYLDVVMSFKNATTIGIGANEITSVKVIYSNGYEYDSFSTLEESGGTDFTYTNINKVEPLKSIILHHLAELPIEAKDSGEPIKLMFTVYGSNYELQVR